MSASPAFSLRSLASPYAEAKGTDPPPMDSGFRRNDVMDARNDEVFHLRTAQGGTFTTPMDSGFRGMTSFQSLPHHGNHGSQGRWDHSPSFQSLTSQFTRQTGSFPPRSNCGSLLVR